MCSSVHFLLRPKREGEDTETIVSLMPSVISYRNIINLLIIYSCNKYVAWKKNLKMILKETQDLRQMDTFSYSPAPG